MATQVKSLVCRACGYLVSWRSTSIERGGLGASILPIVVGNVVALFDSLSRRQIGRIRTAVFLLFSWRTGGLIEPIRANSASCILRNALKLREAQCSNPRLLIRIHVPAPCPWACCPICTHVAYWGSLNACKGSSAWMTQAAHPK